MRVGIIQASSQTDKNELLFQSTVEATLGQNHEIVNLGCFPEEQEQYSYIEIALEVSLLLSSGSVDFMITGCSSGQGMMLACNNCPGVMCGYVENPQDAFLFGRINDGNAVSLPLGLNFGWAGEINLACTLEQLFAGPFGCGYPEKDADRKCRDTHMLKQIHRATYRKAIEVFDGMLKPDYDFIRGYGDSICVHNRLAGVDWEKEMSRTLRHALTRKNVTDYILLHGTNLELVQWIRENS